MSPTIFLSCVSSEFGDWRGRLAAFLEASKRLHVRHQADFVERGVSLLVKLFEEVNASSVVFYITGTQAGALANVEQVDQLLQHLPDFETRFPDVTQLARQGQITYTQWEAWLAAYAKKRLCCYRLRAALSDPQQAHVNLLEKYDHFSTEIESEDKFREQVVLTLLQLDLWSQPKTPELIKSPKERPLQIGLVAVAILLFAGWGLWMTKPKAYVQRNPTREKNAAIGETIAKHKVGSMEHLIEKGLLVPDTKTSLSLTVLKEVDSKLIQLEDGGRLRSEMDVFVIAVEPFTEGYLYIFQVDSHHKVNWYFPANPLEELSHGQNPVGPSRMVFVPPVGSGEGLYLDNNLGDEVVCAVLSPVPWDSLESVIRNTVEQKLAVSLAVSSTGDRAAGGTKKIGESTIEGNWNSTPFKMLTDKFEAYGSAAFVMHRIRHVGIQE